MFSDHLSCLATLSLSPRLCLTVYFSTNSQSAWACCPFIKQTTMRPLTRLLASALQRSSALASSSTSFRSLASPVATHCQVFISVHFRTLHATMWGVKFVYGQVVCVLYMYVYVPLHIKNNNNNSGLGLGQSVDTTLMTTRILSGTDQGQRQRRRDAPRCPMRCKLAQIVAYKLFCMCRTCMKVCVCIENKNIAQLKFHCCTSHIRTDKEHS